MLSPNLPRIIQLLATHQQHLYYCLFLLLGRILSFRNINAFLKTLCASLRKAAKGLGAIVTRLRNIRVEMRGIRRQLRNAWCTLRGMWEDFRRKKSNPTPKGKPEGPKPKDGRRGVRRRTSRRHLLPVTVQTPHKRRFASGRYAEPLHSEGPVLVVIRRKRTEAARRHATTKKRRPRLRLVKPRLL